jgi:PAS domain S-box-containing protein
MATARKLSKPLEEFNAHTQGIAKGEYGFTWKRSHYREIESLAKSFRSMIDSVQDREQRIKDSEHKFKELFHNATDTIFLWEIRGNETIGNCLEVNEVARNMLGYSRQEFFSFIPKNICSSDSVHKIPVVTKELIKNSRATFEMTFRTKTGEEIPVEINSHVFAMKGQKVALSIARDISKRKESEKLIRESEKRYRTVLEANPDPIVIYDIEGNVIYFNPAFTLVFGWPLEERIGKKMDVFVPEKHWPETEIMIKEVLSGKRISGVQSQRYTKEGNIISVSISSSCFQDTEGNPVGIVVNLRDVSNQKKMEIQLQQAQKMESIGTLAGGIAHDFNNILGIIIGNTELAIDDVSEKHPARLSLDEIQKASLRARDVVHQLLSFSRKTELKRKPINITNVIKESLKLIRASIPSNIDILQTLPGDIDTISADTTQINQVIINLCTNAAHAMQYEGGTLEVSLKNMKIDEDSATNYDNFQAGSYVNLMVKDNGQGISQEDIDRIFDPYFTTKEMGKGTGLGLAVVHGIVKSHDGEIKVNSDLNKGTTFSIFFPAIKAKPDVEIETIGELPIGNERILFVDDEEFLLDAGSRILDRLGYRVTTEMNPLKALSLFRSGPDQFDIIITDMAMPNMTGDKLIKEILTIRSDIPTILCTGFSEIINGEKAKKVGAKEYIEKPINKHLLAVTVRRVLDGN